MISTEVLRIERRRGLVGEDDVGFLHDRARDADALALPARQRVGALRREAGQADRVEQLESAAGCRAREICAARRATPARSRAGRTAGSPSPSGVRPDCIPGTPCRSGAGRCFSCRPESRPDPARETGFRRTVGLHQAVDAADQRALAGAGRTDDGGQPRAAETSGRCRAAPADPAGIPWCSPRRTSARSVACTDAAAPSTAFGIMASWLLGLLLRRLGLARALPSHRPPCCRACRNSSADLADDRPILLVGDREEAVVALEILLHLAAGSGNRRSTA